MKRIWPLYLLLFLATMIQISVTRCGVWLPDVVLMVVVFAGLFYGTAEGLCVAAAAGFLRGVTAAAMFPLFLMLLPALSLLASAMSRMFDRSSPLAQMAITGVILLCGIALRTIYLNVISDSDLAIAGVVAGSWRMITVTVIVSPAFFYGFNTLSTAGE